MWNEHGNLHVLARSFLPAAGWHHFFFFQFLHSSSVPFCWQFSFVIAVLSTTCLPYHVLCHLSPLFSARLPASYVHKVTLVKVCNRNVEPCLTSLCSLSTLRKPRSLSIIFNSERVFLRVNRLYRFLLSDLLLFRLSQSAYLFVSTIHEYYTLKW